MKGTCLNNGKLNNSFFNTYKSIFGSSTNIVLNNNPTKFSNDTLCSTYNKFCTLFINNNNGVLTDKIGNATNKCSYLKLEQLSNIYVLNGIIMFNIYNEKEFFFGTIICNGKDQYFSTISDINGNCVDLTVKLKIIYSDGYYDYLNNPLISNIQNEITIEIKNGIRKIILPLDPSGLYTPYFINNSLVGLIPSLYLPSGLDSTYLNTGLQIEEYNITASLYLDNILSLSVGEINTLSIINKNIFNINEFDGLFLNLISVNSTSPLVESGNILTLRITFDYQTGSVGYIATPGLRYPEIILYADNDFDYLNYNPSPARFNTFVIEINNNGTSTLFLPPKPKNFIAPLVLYPENKILPDKIIYNKFYCKFANNSSVFDNATTCQNITLFSDIYDSYDEITGLFGNVIGTRTIFKFILNKNNKIYTGSILYLNFFNNEYLTATYVIKNGLDKNGALGPNLNVKCSIIATSDGYGLDAYFMNIDTFKNHYSNSIGYLQE
jgi:hypothetical protein